MTSVSQVEKHLTTIFHERANLLAKETGCIRRVRKFDGAALLQTLVFGWVQHPMASLEQFASMAQLQGVHVTDSAIEKRFTPEAATFLQAILQEMTRVVIQTAHPIPESLLRRFSAVILEDSSTVRLPEALSWMWQGCGGSTQAANAAVKLHVCWELKTGRIWGPSLTDGRQSDRRSPFGDEACIPGSLSVRDLGYFDGKEILQRQQQQGYSLSRLPSVITVFTRQGQVLDLRKVAPRQVGQSKELPILMGGEWRVPMRLLMLRVPAAVAAQRRADLALEALRRQKPIPQQAYTLADWTILVTDVPRRLLSLQEVLVVLRERWQMELLFKLWKSDGYIDEWLTDNPWRILCELYAKLIGMVLQHWLIVLFAWDNPQRSLVKLAQVVRDTGWTIMEALGGARSLRSALKTIGKRMQSGCSLNKRQQHPNSAQLLAQGLDWAIDP